MQKTSPKAKKLSVPRELEAIQTAYQQACSNLGQLEYQIFINEGEAEKMKEQIRAINNEAAARMQLNKAKETPASDDAKAQVEAK